MPLKYSPKSSIYKWLIGILAILVVLVGGFIVWANSPPEPGMRAQHALQSSENVNVIIDNGYVFQPRQQATSGFILYPGGRVDPASYAAVAHNIAEAGYLVVIPKLRLNLAVFDQNAATEVIDAYPEIKRWTIGGHSLGGTMAAQYASRNPNQIYGLALWAAYPPGNTDLSGSNLLVTSIFGNQDGLTTYQNIENSRSQLPSSTLFVTIDGGNHAQFGDYGPQSGDNPAAINPTEQQAQVVEATVQLLQAVETRQIYGLD